MQYDTTFNLTNFYVSVLNIIHPFLIDDKQRPPPIPIGYFQLFDETMINVDPSLLSNLLITFDIDTIKHYFEDDAWLLVLDVVKKKLTSILCKICNNSCLLSYAECEICKFFYHFECERISTYFRNKIKDGHKSWKCSSCKGSKQNQIAD